VKTAEDIVKKNFALFFLVIYLFMVSTYMVYLPRYYNPKPKISITSNTARINGGKGSNDSYIQVHGIKAVPENKRKAIDFLIKTASLVFLLIFGGTTLPGLIRRSAASLNIFLYAHQHYYLTYGTLRI
jgi:hypothetical protein